MTPTPNDATRDPLAAYVDGDPDVVRAAAPREPCAAQWDAVQSRIHARLDRAMKEPTRQSWRAAVALVATFAAAAAAVAWVAFAMNGPKPLPLAPEVAKPAPQESDPLPMAVVDDVVLLRVPGDGWLPVGAPPLPAALSFASAEDVELDDLNPAWPRVTLAPGDVPMIFAAKPR